MHRLYIIGAVFWALAALCFFLLQNTDISKGGEISLAKSFWLGITIFMWIYIPSLAAFNHTLKRKLRISYVVFLLNMLARAIIELILMYGYNAWQYEYGIAHNLISILILAILYFWTRSSQPTIWRTNLAVMLGMFCAELYFALYMVLHMRKGDNSEIWFVPWSTEHLLNNGLTILVLLALVLWQIPFYRKGIRNA